MAEEKKLPAKVSDSPDSLSVAAYYEYMSKIPSFKTNRDVRKHLEFIAFAANHKLMDPKIVNCNVYIAQNVMIAIDRIRLFERGEIDGLDEIADADGNIILTRQQSAEVLQQASPQIQIQMMEKFVKENAKKVNTEKFSEPDEAIDAAVTEIKEKYDFCEDIEF